VAWIYSYTVPLIDGSHAIYLAARDFSGDCDSASMTTKVLFTWAIMMIYSFDLPHNEMQVAM
jgi:hypothetical protein